MYGMMKSGMGPGMPGVRIDTACVVTNMWVLVGRTK